MFTKFGRGQLNNGGDGRAGLYGGWGGGLYIHWITMVKTAQDRRSL